MPAENIKMKTNPCLQGVHNLKGKDKHETITLMVIFSNRGKLMKMRDLKKHLARCPKTWGRFLQRIPCGMRIWNEEEVRRSCFYRESHI